MGLYLRGKTGKLYYVLIEQKLLKKTEGRCGNSTSSTSITIYYEKPQNKKQMGICGTILSSDYAHSVAEMIEELMDDCDKEENELA